MSGALALLISLQAFWLRSAFMLKQKQFEQLVNRTLSEIVDQIKEQETLLYVLEEFRSVSIDTLHSKKLPIRSPGPENNHPKFQNHTLSILKNGKQLEVVNDSLVFENDTLVFVFGNNPSQKPGYNLNYKEYKFNRDAIDSLGRMMGDRRVFVESIISKMMRVNQGAEGRISPHEIHRLIVQKFRERGINLEYAYAVFDNQHRLVFHSPHFDPAYAGRVFNTKLFPGDTFNPNDELVVYFPDEKNFVYRSLGFMASTTILLTLFIVAIFTFSVLMIVRHRKLSEMKSDFINNMTHELKTPISTLSLASQMLNDPGIPMERKNLPHLTEIIGSEVRRLSRHVERVLQAATFESGRIRLKHELTNLNYLVEKTLRNFRIQIEKLEGSLTFMPDMQQPQVMLDEVHFTNVLNNLLDNAMKYSGQHPRIEVSTAVKGESVILSVKDSGPGIHKKDHKRVFEKFYRVPTGNVHNTKGFGLGLSYVKKIVEEHEGTIRIESEPNKGATFIITLPHPAVSES